MPALRSSTISATYQMLGSETPAQVMQEFLDNAIEAGKIEAYRIEHIKPIRQASDFFNIYFQVDAPLDGGQRMGDLFADAKAITDEIVHDTDTVITAVQFND